MLVLSRKVGESLVIGDGIKVTVTRIKGNRITLGIEAARDVPVRRGEIDPKKHNLGGNQDGSDSDS